MTVAWGKFSSAVAKSETKVVFVQSGFGLVIDRFLSLALSALIPGGKFMKDVA